MNNFLIVVNNPERWNLAIPGVELVSARDYLTNPAYAAPSRSKILNLCRSYRYQAVGYYVSLLAEARGHIPMPSVTTIQDFKSQTIIKSVSADLQDLIDKALKPIRSDHFELSIYFSRNMAQRYEALSRRLFNLFPAPLLRATFRKREDSWELQNISPVSSAEIPDDHRPFVIEAAHAYLSRKIRIPRKRHTARYDIAILVDPEEKLPASNEAALRKFEKAAEDLDMRPERLTEDDYGALAEFDALFIRATTAVNNYTYRFSRRAQAEGLVVIDDPISILRCGNKVYLHEILTRNRINAPPTWVIHKDNVEEMAQRVSFPCILKQPDSSFSQGVVKVSDAASWTAKLEELHEISDLVIAQKFVPTDFDWRIGVLDREVLYACKYFMARGHWQIYNHGAGGDNRYGTFETLPLPQVPHPVLEAASRAARLIGDGFYGVDLKVVDGKPCIIEINDNPSIDAGVEDEILGDALYRAVMQTFFQRIQHRHE